MQRQIDYHLAQARAAASGATPSAQCAVTDSVNGLMRTVGRMYADRDLAMTSSVPPTIAVRTADVGVVQEGASVAFTVDDDGPGVPPERRRTPPR